MSPHLSHRQSHRLPHHAGTLRRAVSAFLLTTTLAACRDGTAPLAALRVEAVADLQGAPTIEALSDGTPYLQCIVSLRTTATGGARGEWLGATLRWYYGATRTTAIDSVEVTAEELRGAWNEGPEIVPGQFRTTGFIMSATVPFWADIDLHYRGVTGDRTERVAKAPFRCGPAIPANAAPPVVTSVVVQPPAGPLEPGDTLTVTMSASSPATIWRSAIVLGGPCEVNVEHVDSLAPSIARTVRVPIPTNCALDVPIRVTGFVLDGAARSASRVTTTTYRLVDDTPPTVQPRFFPRYVWESELAPAGVRYVGDSLPMIANAGDNGRLAWFIWEMLPSGVRDSMQVSGSFAHIVNLPILAGWIGAERMRFSARDLSGNESAPVEVSASQMRVLPDADRVVRSVVVPGEIRWAVVDERRGVVYLQQSNQSRIAVLDVASMSVVRTIATPAPPTGMDLTASGDSLVFALPGPRTIGVIDLRAATPSTTSIALPWLDVATLDQRPGAVYAMANGRLFVAVSGNTGASVQLFELDPATATARLRTDAGDAGNVAGTAITRSGDRGMLVLNGGSSRFQRYTSSTDTFSARTTAPHASWSPAVDWTGATFALGAHLYDGGMSFVRTVETPASLVGSSWPTALSADGSALYHVLAAGLIRSRTSDGRLMDRVRLPESADYALAWPGSARIVAVKSSTQGSSRVMIVE